MPTRLQLLHSWTRQLQGLVPIARITRVRTWAALSLGLLWGGQIAVLKIAATVPGPATDLSRVRAFRRWLANPKVQVERLWPPVLRALLAGRREGRLVFDPTPQAGHATLLIVGIAVHKRILPVAWRAVPQQRRWPERQIVLLRAMCQLVAAALPTDAHVTLVVDRGITSAAVIDLGRSGSRPLARRSAVMRSKSPRSCDVRSTSTAPGQVRPFACDCLRASRPPRRKVKIGQPGLRSPWRSRGAFCWGPGR